MQIYGKVNQATMFWDDGAEQNVYSVNNQYSSTRFGFESAAMHLYLAYQHFDADMSLVTRDPSVSPNGKLKNVPVSIDDFDLIYSGGRIYF